MTLHMKLIAGEWVGTEASENISPSDTGEVGGLYASASAEEGTPA